MIMKYYLFKMSFPFRLKKSIEKLTHKNGWIPAFADMTVSMQV